MTTCRTVCTAVSAAVYVTVVKVVVAIVSPEAISGRSQGIGSSRFHYGEPSRGQARVGLLLV
jgi:hypothetical protein